MGRYIINRIIALFITLFIIMSVFFVLLRLQPGGPFSPGGGMKPEIRQKLVQKYSLDKPLTYQYAKYLGNVFTGDFGDSMKVKPGVPVIKIIKEKLPITVLLNILSLFLIIPVGVFMGTLAAIKKNTWVDQLINILVIIFVSIPAFVLAALMQYFLAFKMNLFPLRLTNSLTWDAEKMKSIILPVLALSFGSIATITRYMRSELSEQMNSDYMLLAKTKGLNTVQALFKHALRNAFVPLLPIFLGQFIFIFGGSFVIETIFGIPGMGSTSIEAINTQDYALTMAISSFSVFIGLAFTLLIDLLYGVVDPRIRIGGKK